MRRTILLCLAISFVSGCTRYYQVTDPASGKVYYTKGIGRTRTGAVQFTTLDDKARITLQSSEVRQIEKTALPDGISQ